MPVDVLDIMRRLCQANLKEAMETLGEMRKEARD